MKSNMKSKNQDIYNTKQMSMKKLSTKTIYKMKIQTIIRKNKGSILIQSKTSHNRQKSC